MKIRTWQFELAFVATVLAGINLLTRCPPTEWVGAGAVLLTFAHASIADRMAEGQAAMPRPTTDCYKWNLRYFVGKELLWVSYFLLHRSYAAMVGCLVFLAYPIWRAWYRRRWPRGRSEISV